MSTPQKYSGTLRERKREANRVYRAKNKATLNARRKGKTLHSRDYVFGKGATVHFHKQIKDQEGQCPICLKPLPSGRNTHFDHNHDTGRFRGALCIHCNHLLGRAQDSQARLLRAVDYLQKWEN